MRKLKGTYNDKNNDKRILIPLPKGCFAKIGVESSKFYKKRVDEGDSSGSGPWRHEGLIKKRSSVEIFLVRKDMQMLVCPTPRPTAIEDNIMDTNNDDVIVDMVFTTPRILVGKQNEKTEVQFGSNEALSIHEYVFSKQIKTFFVKCRAHTALEC